MTFLQGGQGMVALGASKPGARGGTVTDWLFGGSGAAAVDSMLRGTR